MHSWFMWKLLGGQSCSEETSHCPPLPYSGKHRGPGALLRWKEWEMEGKGQEPLPRGSARRAWSACCRHSSSTANLDIDGPFPSMPKDFKVYPGLPYDSGTPVGGSPGVARTSRAENLRKSNLRSHNCVWLWWRRGPLTKAWYLLIHFLSSLAGHLNLEAECTVGKNRLVSGSMLCELEPWLRVRVFEQPGKISLGSHSTVSMWTQVPGIQTHEGSLHGP